MHLNTLQAHIYRPKVKPEIKRTVEDKKAHPVLK
jgi:hypothetical protein